MNKKQENYFRMFLSTQDFLNDNPTVWNTVPRAVLYKNDLDEIIARIMEKDEDARSGIGVKEQKSKCKEFISLKLSAISGAMHAYAYETGDMDLANKTRVSKSEVLKIDDARVNSFAKSIITEAEKRLTELEDFGVSVFMVDEVLASVEDFNGLMGKPRSILNNKFEAISAVAQLFDEGNNILRNQMDKIMLIFRDECPDFYRGYERARTIVDK